MKVYQIRSARFCPWFKPVTRGPRAARAVANVALLGQDQDGERYYRPWEEDDLADSFAFSEARAKELMAMYKGVIKVHDVEILELPYDDSAPIYRPTRIDAAGIRIKAQLGNCHLWPHRGLGRETRTLSIDGRIVNIEFKLKSLHGSYGGPPPSAWIVVTKSR